MNQVPEEVLNGCPATDAESLRLAAESARDPAANWKRWGPYVPERQWATVREDYSLDQKAWRHLTHDVAVHYAYRWGEDGLFGLTDRQCRLCFAPTFWNGCDSILKERLFGLGGPEGNHGEDVKECYFYLDCTPTHSYMKALYKYPHREFPYAELRQVNAERGRQDDEYELIDTGIFDEDRYFDIVVEYAKAGPEDILIRISAYNRGANAARLVMLPTLWFRNIWDWHSGDEANVSKPQLKQTAPNQVTAEHDTLGEFQLFVDVGPDGTTPPMLFTENETNRWKIDDPTSSRPSCKDAFHQYVINQHLRAVNPRPLGTKGAAHYDVMVPPGEEAVVFRMRLAATECQVSEPFGSDFDGVFSQRIAEADEFYATKIDPDLSVDEKRVMRQAYAGLLWSKQFFYYDMRTWLSGEPEHPELFPPRPGGRNAEWKHLFNRDVLSVPDKWEYPWYAAWDSAFHMIPFSKLDPAFSKEQLLLFLREWYMHPNGQIPAYEWNFGDVNPPVHAWACWKVYQRTAADGDRDRDFLARAFQKMLLNFTWWVNRKDIRGQNVFSGGFLGLDNIGIFDRSKPLPTGGHLEQADGTAWMAFYCSSMLSMALELAADNPAYEDLASKFFEHYVTIAEAMNSLDGTGLWDDEDGFYYDHLHVDGKSVPLRIRSIVGVIPLFTVDILHHHDIEKLSGFRKRMDWFLRNRSDIVDFMTYMESRSPEGESEPLHLLAIPTRERLERILYYLLDEDEFLSQFGVRSLSKYHDEHPFTFQVNGETLTVRYLPGESDSGLFGGNSNWRGPIWFPLNYLLIESLERYHQFYGDTLRVECPTRSGNYMNLGEVADEIRKRLASLFLLTEEGKRPCYNRGERFLNDPHWKDLVLFYEYFHADNGRGLGASHQTGWTSLVAPLLEQISRRRHGRSSMAELHVN